MYSKHEIFTVAPQARKNMCVVYKMLGLTPFYGMYALYKVWQV